MFNRGMHLVGVVWRSRPSWDVGQQAVCWGSELGEISLSSVRRAAVEFMPWRWARQGQGSQVIRRCGARGSRPWRRRLAGVRPKTTIISARDSPAPQSRTEPQTLVRVRAMGVLCRKALFDPAMGGLDPPFTGSHVSPPLGCAHLSWGGILDKNWVGDRRPFRIHTPTLTHTHFALRGLEHESCARAMHVNSKRGWTEMCACAQLCGCSAGRCREAGRL